MKAKYLILGALALTLVACEERFFDTDSPSAMDEAILYFEKVKGVQDVSRDRVNYLDRRNTADLM